MSIRFLKLPERYEKCLQVSHGKESTEVRITQKISVFLYIKDFQDKMKYGMKLIRAQPLVLSALIKPFLNVNLVSRITI